MDNIFIFLNLSCLLFFGSVRSSQDIMMGITKTFGVAAKQCTEQETLNERALIDFYNFWREDYNQLSREFGCMILCLSKKFELVTEEHVMHHANTHEFVKSFGGDDALAKKLVDMIHDCEKIHESITDDCSRILEVAKCFKTKSHELNWAPKIEQVLAEIVMEF